jgi:hypothetical protein
MLRNYTNASVLAMLLALPTSAIADSDKFRHDAFSAEDRLIREHRRFAGSKDNAESLVEGLRFDKPVQLASRSDSTTTFTSPTGKMGWGNVDIALSLAKATLADHGIRNPSPEQIKAALNGGTVTTKSGAQVTLPGVLKLRASGMGWGRIAQKHGFKLGEVMRDDHHRRHKHADRKHDHKHADRKHDHKHADWKHERKHDDWKHDRGDFQRARFDRPDRPHKFERPERPERPERHHRR